MSSFKRSYSQLILLPSYEDRLDYLQLHGVVAHQTFGSSRYMNQIFYMSSEWKNFRDGLILRDSGCDLGILDRPIHGKIILHHINPITEDDLIDRSDRLFDPENLICVSLMTHNAIHYGTEKNLIPVLMERSPDDTCPWKGGKL